MKIDVYKLNSKGQHYLKAYNLIDEYTQAELDELLSVYTPEPVATVADTMYDDFVTQKVAMRKVGHTHDWLAQEDEFIYNNYQYLSDTVMALALNIPSRYIKSRRHVKGWLKREIPKGRVVVWCNRSDFEADMDSTKLRARPE